MWLNAVKNLRTVKVFGMCNEQRRKQTRNSSEVFLGCSVLLLRVSFLGSEHTTHVLHCTWCSVTKCHWMYSEMPQLRLETVGLNLEQTLQDPDQWISCSPKVFWNSRPLCWHSRPFGLTALAWLSHPLPDSQARGFLKRNLLWMSNSRK